ncbi:unnamed protein product [Umbelopsis sp. WA50703]
MGVAISKADDNKTSAMLEKCARDPSVRNRRKKNQRRLSKSMIGKPSDFKHTNHIGHGDFASNIAGVKDQIAEITVTFNATTKVSLVNRKPIAGGLSLPVPLAKQIGVTKQTAVVTRKKPMETEDPNRFSPGNRFVGKLSKQPLSRDGQKPDNTRVSPGKLRFQKSATTSPITLVDMYTDSIHTYLNEQKRLEMMKDDLERFSRSENNLRRYASCNHLLQLATSRESFAF